MKVLVLNSGSSSIKFQLFDMPSESIICSGLVERIGFDDAKIHYKTNEFKLDETLIIKNHKSGLKKIVDLILNKQTGVINSTEEIEIVGHRVVHGGSTFSKTTIITAAVKNKIKKLFTLAPLHNPPNYEGILIAEEIFAKATQVAVFDTAFHQTIPTKASQYAIPKKFYDKHNVQLYGFHGSSHKFVSEKAIAYLGMKISKIISIHLGNGCSITAIKDGKSTDHSLGFSPINGLIMGTRSGDIDHSIIFHLVNNLGYSLKDVNRILQKESGMYGLTGYSDMREIESEAKKGNRDCQLALDMNAYRIKKYIGSYVAAMNGLDAIIFTAGIGENSSYMRSLVCKEMDSLGIQLNEETNTIHSNEIREIQSQSSKIKVLVIPTNEEVEIARQSFHLIHQN